MYTPKLNLIETEHAITQIKREFEAQLSAALNLTRISAPLFVLKSSGLNDDLNGVERPVAFDIGATGETAEVVHSLAKWKRYALAKYRFGPRFGLYCDMNAIRRDETPDRLHSLYVDQWDWEVVITRGDRTRAFLCETVKKIYAALRETAEKICRLYPALDNFLDEEIGFVTTQQLEDMYPDRTPKERETAYVREHGATFIMQIGGKLNSGEKHDGRAPDYDDWELNGDIMLYYPVRTLLHGHPRGRKEPRPPARGGALHGAPAPTFPQGARGGGAAAHDGRRYRTVAPVHVPSEQTAHRRSAGIRLG